MQKIEKIISQIHYATANTSKLSAEQLRDLAQQYTHICEHVSCQIKECFSLITPENKRKFLSFLHYHPHLLKQCEILNIPERKEWLIITQFLGCLPPPELPLKELSAIRRAKKLLLSSDTTTKKQKDLENSTLKITPPSFLQNTSAKISPVAHPPVISESSSVSESPTALNAPALSVSTKPSAKLTITKTLNTSAESSDSASPPITNSFEKNFKTPIFPPPLPPLSSENLKKYPSTHDSISSSKNVLSETEDKYHPLENTDPTTPTLPCAGSFLKFPFMWFFTKKFQQNKTSENSALPIFPQKKLNLRFIFTFLFLILFSVAAVGGVYFWTSQLYISDNISLTIPENENNAKTNILLKENSSPPADMPPSSDAHEENTSDSEFQTNENQQMEILKTLILTGETQKDTKTSKNEEPDVPTTPQITAQEVMTAANLIKRIPRNAVYQDAGRMILLPEINKIFQELWKLRNAVKIVATTYILEKKIIFREMHSTWILLPIKEKNPRAKGDFIYWSDAGFQLLASHSKSQELFFTEFLIQTVDFPDISPTKTTFSFLPSAVNSSSSSKTLFISETSTFYFSWNDANIIHAIQNASLQLNVQFTFPKNTDSITFKISQRALHDSDVPKISPGQISLSPVHTNIPEMEKHFKIKYHLSPADKKLFIKIIPKDKHISSQKIQRGIQKFQNEIMSQLHKDLENYAAKEKYLMQAEKIFQNTQNTDEKYLRNLEKQWISEDVPLQAQLTLEKILPFLEYLNVIRSSKIPIQIQLFAVHPGEEKALEILSTE
ncbi:MAG: hypothetical protein Q4C96_06425 [Planctomycetia bacterium]|nr:hypothetical protein [Planctomycetia bacterium]